jgi:hypothetical protein
MSRPPFWIALILVALAPLHAQESPEPPPADPPVFRGLMGAGPQAVALFEVTGVTGTWSGEIGKKVPGTGWTIKSAATRPARVVIDVPQKGELTLKRGQTYRGGEGPVDAAPAQAQASPSPGEPERVTTIDVSKGDAKIEELGQAGFDTAVMVTSPACGACRLITPEIRAAGRKPGKRLVFLDIGTTGAGKINWTAPFLKKRGLQAIPHFYVLGSRGEFIEGKAALEKVRSW